MDGLKQVEGEGKEEKGQGAGSVYLRPLFLEEMETLEQPFTFVLLSCASSQVFILAYDCNQ